MYVNSLYSRLALAFALGLASCALVGCGDDDDGPPPDAGMAGKGGRGGGDGMSGRGGRGGRGGAGPVAGSEAPSCRDRLGEAGPLFELAGAQCDACLCNAKAETLMCTGDCARLVYCVSESSCLPSDTPCIRGACEAKLGGTDAFMKAVMQVARTPFFACASACFLEGDPDAGS